MGLSVQEKKWKIDFQDGNCGGHLVFPIRTILAIFYLQVTLMILTKFQVNWPFGSGEEAENRFSRWLPWWPSWISDRNNFSCFDLLVTPKFPTQVLLNWPFGSGEEAILKMATMVAILDFWSLRFYFFFFYLQVTLMLPTKLQVNWLFGSGEKAKIDFQNGPHSGHLGFQIRTILAISDLQITPMIPTKFQVNWPFGSGEEAKNRFSRWLLWRLSWISNRNHFSYFWSTSHSDASYQVSSQLAFQLRRIN